MFLNGFRSMQKDAGVSVTPENQGGGLHTARKAPVCVHLTALYTPVSLYKHPQVPIVHALMLDDFKDIMTDIDIRLRLSLRYQ